MKERDVDVRTVEHRWIKKDVHGTAERKHTIGCKRLHIYYTYINNVRERRFVCVIERGMPTHTHTCKAELETFLLH